MSIQTAITMESLNPNVKKMEYAVRGPIVTRAVEIERELERGIKKPFNSVIKANIGDAQAMGQRPITFFREVLACVTNPTFIEKQSFAADVRDHAKTILDGCGGCSVGSYSQSVGIDIIRTHVADFIRYRDGIAADPENIILCGGASDGIRSTLKLFINSHEKEKGVMLPIPQYPLYSATIDEYGLVKVPYYLDEDKNWSLTTDELERAISESRESCETRILCVINPGNPTGQILSRKNIQEICRFATKHNLFVLADEVYQDNVYADGCKFHSFKKVMTEMGPPYSRLGLASFYSVSKGYMGECGLRGGYVEVVNMEEEVFAQFKKMMSAKLCSTTLGQVAMDCAVNPPKFGDPSYGLWLEEKTTTLKSLKCRAELVRDALNSLEGVTCHPVQGAMYAFPKITLPQKAINEAKSRRQEPDFFYALELLESSGICIVPGSGFGQKPGTYHFRTTILPQPALMKDMLQRFTSFHKKFMQEYA